MNFRNVDTKQFDSINDEEAKTLIDRLSVEIQKHNDAYYRDDKPLISDAEYDQLLIHLSYLEKKFPQFLNTDSPTQLIGGKIQEKFKKHHHIIPMLSLANAFSQQDVEDFISKIQRFLNIDHIPPMHLEPKIDGVSFSLIYKNQVLVSASTRGDGYIGEDITNNVKTIKNIPLFLKNAPEIIEIRGEIYIEKEDFVILNNQQKKQNKQVFANPRNCAAGSLRQLDSDVTASRPLKYFVYSVGEQQGNPVNNYTQLFDQFRKWNFCVNPLEDVATSVEDIMIFYNKVQQVRDSLPYEIDGTVYKINDFVMQNRLGSIGRSPRSMIAHKFPAIFATTRLINIIVQVGRTGVLTPVAILEPINIAGTVVKRATLHNYQEIERKDIRIGDMVYLQRAGDVIPKITGVDYKERNLANNTKKFIFPTNCPSCESTLIFDTSDVIIRCNNVLQCPSQISRAIEHFVSKEAMNIDAFGAKQIEFFLKHGMIKNVCDIFYLQNRDADSLNKIENMKGWGKKSVTKLFQNIEKSKNISLEKFIYSLGIRHIGTSNAKILASEFKNAPNFLQSMIDLANIANQDGHNHGNNSGDNNNNDNNNNNEPINDHDWGGQNISKQICDRLANIDGIGDKILGAVKEFFLIDRNVKVVGELLTILNVEDFKEIKSNLPLFGEVVVFTGKLESVSRSEAKEQAERMGAKISSTVTSKTTLLVAGVDAGSKLKDAQKMNIPIINETEWLAKIT